MRLPLVAQLGCTLFIPMALLLWIGGARLAGMRHEAMVADGQARRAELLVATARLIDAWQKERGASVVAAAGGGAVADLAALRADADARLASWRGVAAAAGFQAAPDAGELARLATAARQGAGPADIRERYTVLISVLLDLQAEIPNAPTMRGLGKALSAAATLEAAKEHAGQLRAHMSGMVAADRPLADADFAALQAHMSQVAALMGARRLTLSGDRQQRLRDLQASAAWRSVDRAFDAVSRHRGEGHFGLDAKQVFADTSAVVAGLGAIIEAEAEAVARQSQDIAGELSATFWQEVVLLSTCGAAAFALSLWLALRITGGLGLARRRLAEIAEGRIAASELPRERLARLARRGDELGDLGRGLAAAEGYLADMAAAAGALADGELAARIPVRGDRDEFGRAFARMVETLARTIGEIAQASQAMAAAATELAATSQQLASGSQATQEAAASAANAARQGVEQVQTLAAAAEELSASVREVAQQTTQVAGLAQGVGADVGKAVASAQGSLERMAALDAMGKRIGEVLKLIAAVAGQTNLLALNATIEAARAGEAGRGFAVVANEVKALAHQTAEATGRIAEQITAIQGEIAQAVQGSGEAVQTVRGIGSSSASMGESTGAVAAAVEEQAATAKEMAHGLADTSSGLDAIVAGLSRMTVQTGEVAQGAAHIQTAAQELDRLAQALQVAVGRFRR